MYCVFMKDLEFKILLSLVSTTLISLLLNTLLFLGLSLPGPDTSVGWELKRNRQHRSDNAINRAFLCKKIKSDGFVTQWKYVSTASAPFIGIIWRQYRKDHFEIVDINYIPGAPINQNVTYNVPAAERIYVKNGDFMGFYFISHGVFWYDFSRKNMPGSDRSSCHFFTESDVGKIRKGLITRLSHAKWRAYSLQLTVESGE